MKTLVLAMVFGCFDGCFGGWRSVPNTQSFVRVDVGCGHTGFDQIPRRVTIAVVINATGRPLTLYVDGQRAVAGLPPGKNIPIRLRYLSDYYTQVELVAAVWDGKRFTHEARRLTTVGGDYRRSEPWEINDQLLQELPSPSAARGRPRMTLQVNTPIYGWQWNTNAVTVINDSPYDWVVSRDGRKKLWLKAGSVDYINLPHAGWGAAYTLTAQPVESGRVIGRPVILQVYSSGYYQYSQAWTIAKEMFQPLVSTKK